ncbi:MFS transporter [Cumulibacter manganitolerans]|uniref:MFS transporter n=1 Tax=Cumulibacter manganitolerans TaxID=1884992 RepID=UPI001294F4FB|nr:MFS transporter [Cumulibacter manganitolerans]
MTEGSSASRVHPVWLAVSAVLLLAVNLRMAVSSVGAVLPDVRDGSGLGGFATGLLTALPPFCFGIAGLTGPAIARRIGLHRTALLTLVLIAVGQVVRAAVPGALWLFVGSVVALAAIALANVILPSIVREMFPGRIAGMTAAYTVVMSLAQAMVAFSTIPLMHAFGGDWRLGIGMWAAVAVLAVLPWLPLARHEAPPVRTSAHRLPLRTIARVPKAWILALFFGSQSMQAYIAFGWYPTLLRDEGLARQSAAAQVGIVSVAATIATIFAPTLLGRLRRPAIVTWVLFAGYVLGYLGLLAWPLQLTTLWSILIGIGQTYFPIALYVVNLRAKTPTGVLSLSGFMQSVGYIWAGTGLLLLGTIHGRSTDWNGVLVVMIGLVCLLQILAVVSVSRWSIEEELRERRLLPAGAAR